ncbi:hypothetical protein Tco_0765654 [Tanacetum coccineum]
MTIPFFIMENANPPPTNNRPFLPVMLCVQAVQELHELQRISAFVDSRLESIEQFLRNFVNHPNETNVNDLESDDESVDTPLVSPFPHSDNDSDDGEVLNELSPEYKVNESMKEWLIRGLYLMRRSLEVLRKFHWMILGGRFNQLSHVSSPLLSKPGEY